MACAVATCSAEELRALTHTLSAYKRGTLACLLLLAFLVCCRFFFSSSRDLSLSFSTFCARETALERWFRITRRRAPSAVNGMNGAEELPMCDAHELFALAARARFGERGEPFSERRPSLG